MKNAKLKSVKELEELLEKDFDGFMEEIKNKTLFENRDAAISLGADLVIKLNDPRKIYQYGVRINQINKLSYKDTRLENKMKIAKAVVETKNSEYIYDYMYMKKIANEQEVLDILVKGLVETKVTKLISEVCIYKKDLDRKNRAILIKGLVDANNPEWIMMLTEEDEQLSEEEITILTDGIIRLGKEVLIKKFLFSTNIINKIKIEDRIKLIKNIKSASNIHNVMWYFSDLTKEEEHILTKNMVLTKNAEHIYYVVRDGLNLDKKDINMLVNAVSKTKNAQYMYYVATDDKVEIEDKLFLANEIVKTNDTYFIFMFAKNIKGLNTGIIIMLFNRVLMLKDVSVIIDFMEYLKEKNLLNREDVKGNVLNTKNHYLIAKYILLTRNYSLIETVYKMTVESYITLCIMLSIPNEEKIKLIKELRVLDDKNIVKVSDDMLDDYLAKSKIIKKAGV